MRRKKRIDLYWPFMFIWGIILTGACIYGLKFLWDYCSSLETSSPEIILDEYIATLNDDKWRTVYADVLNDASNDMQNADEALAIIKEKIGSEYYYKRYGATVDGVTPYVIYSKEAIIGYVKLREIVTDEKLEIKDYTIVAEEYEPVEIFSSYSVTIPAHFSLYMNDELVPEDFITERDIKFDYFIDYYETIPDLPTKVTYFIDKIVGKVNFTIKDTFGNVIEYDARRPDYVYLNGFVETGEIASELGVSLTDFGKLWIDYYVAYLGNRGGATMTNYSNVCQYFYQDSPLRDRLMKAAEQLRDYSHTYSYSLNYVNLNNIYDLGNYRYLLDYTYEDYANTSYGESTHVQNIQILVNTSTGSRMVEDFTYYNRESE